MDKHGCTQADAADAPSTSQANSSRWLSAGHEPCADILIHIAKAVGVTLEELLRATCRFSLPLIHCPLPMTTRLAFTPIFRTPLHSECSEPSPLGCHHD